MKGILCPTALLPDGWADGVAITFDADGGIQGVRAGVAQSALPRAAGPVIPGMPNVHSHAFQRAMAGLTAQAGPDEDSFWSWRRTMYGFVERLTPEATEAIAAQLYVDLLKNGYTAVGEFHYVHHDRGGVPYPDCAELSHRIVAAARQAGIGLTHLPVLYAYGGFGTEPPDAGQRRFLNDADGLHTILADLSAAYGGDPQFRLGLAPHSLRAVSPELLRDALAMIDALDGTAPIHIHVAEQQKEVDDCLARSGLRPVAWLLEHAPVDARWCLIHATHMTVQETTALAASGAVAGLCPSTEADLGDGLFPAAAYVAAQGRFGIGSDSHVCVSPVEELRWLEYGQRLAHRERNVLRTSGTTSIGAGLYRAALAGGARALGRPLGQLAPGRRADLVVLDAAHPILYEKAGDLLLDAYVFSGGRGLVRDVIVGGRTVIEQGHHAEEENVAQRYREALRTLR